MRAAERLQEIINVLLVGQVDDREAQAPPVAVCLEQIVVPYRHIEQIARFDAGGVTVQVKCGTRNIEQFRPTVDRSGPAACGRQSGGQRWAVVSPAGIDAEEPDGSLLVRVQEARSIREIVEGRIASNQAAVITPIESSPGEFQIGLILEVSCLIEGLIVVNAENFVPADTSAKAGNL